MTAVETVRDAIEKWEGVTVHARRLGGIVASHSRAARAAISTPGRLPIRRFRGGFATTVGLTLTAHDAQKLFGWFCVHGPAGPLSLSRHSDSGN